MKATPPTVAPDLIRGKAPSGDTIEHLRGGPTGQPKVTRVSLTALRNRKGPRT
ncbi:MULTISPECIES: hypothetical protein [unclassified Novosphingobium]|uniref:hypothetical protein n=1 Tax=unclassified Novosphingobium TaxID=2644732 RepID=UPI0025F04299|nr:MULTISPECIES: hypothetical protein [unclassified Novosphingobium]HQS70027.1 hypothetical protein [Novosphingobium sp.]